MNKSFGDQLVELWEEHHKRGEQADTFWRTSPEAFRLRLDEASRQVFGDLAGFLTWEVSLNPGDRLRGRTRIPGYSTVLEWVEDITGLYVFYAWASPPDGSLRKYLIDGRLKLGAILSEEEPPYEADGSLGIGAEEDDLYRDHDDKRDGPVF